MKLPNLIWPRERVVTDTPMVRTGRVLHWAGAAIGTVIAVSALFQIRLTGASGHYEQAGFFDGGSHWVNDQPNYRTALLIGVGIALLGRGVRYILARE